MDLFAPFRNLHFPLVMQQELRPAGPLESPLLSGVAARIGAFPAGPGGSYGRLRRIAKDREVPEKLLSVQWRPNPGDTWSHGMIMPPAGTRKVREMHWFWDNLRSLLKASDTPGRRLGKEPPAPGRNPARLHRARANHETDSTIPHGLPAPCLAENHGWRVVAGLPVAGLGRVLFFRSRHRASTPHRPGHGGFPSSAP